MIKVYVCGKVTGENRGSCVAKFAERSRELTLQGYEVVNPLKLVSEETPWEQAMRICIRSLTTCDAISPIYDSAYSPGSIIELILAIDMGLKIV